VFDGDVDALWVENMNSVMDDNRLLTLPLPHFSPSLIYLFIHLFINTLLFCFRYLVFDGDVDALWVENMNSVMDDNRLLTLANGERIRLQRHCALLFEVSAALCME